jgi:hypothetical protein
MVEGDRPAIYVASPPVGRRLPSDEVIRRACEREILDEPPVFAHAHSATRLGVLVALDPRKQMSQRGWQPDPTNVSGIADTGRWVLCERSAHKMTDGFMLTFGGRASRQAVSKATPRECAAILPLLRSRFVPSLKVSAGLQKLNKSASPHATPRWSHPDPTPDPPSERRSDKPA